MKIDFCCARVAAAATPWSRRPIFGVIHGIYLARLARFFCIEKSRSMKNMIIITNLHYSEILALYSPLNKFSESFKLDLSHDRSLSAHDSETWSTGTWKNRLS